MNPFNLNIDISPSSEVSPSDQFQVIHLQACGLVNDGNVCGLLSLILSLHRTGILKHLLDPLYCMIGNNVPDYPSWIFHRILSALPSIQSFSLQLLIQSWARSGRQQSLQVNNGDISTMAESLVSNLQLKRYSTGPVLTEFTASFNCESCGQQHRRLKNWEGQVQAVIPLLQLPDSDVVANIPNILASYLDSTIQTRCTNQLCRQRISTGKYDTQLGFITILAVNRCDTTNLTQKKLNRLELIAGDPNITGNDLLGEIVSCVCHRGSVQAGHFVSYHKIGRQWYLNDDERYDQIGARH